MDQRPLSPAELRAIDAYWRAANYLSVGQIYLLDNPLLREPLTLEHIKPRLLGTLGHHAGSQLHLCAPQPHHPAGRPRRDLHRRAGPRRARRGREYLSGRNLQRACIPRCRGTSPDCKRLCKQFSFPGGIPSHAAPETPGSIHEGGELGYSLAHAFGAAFDNPDLIVACVVGDGEAETGPLATAWHSNKFLNPVTDGAVLPILHLNGYKIASPTVLARISDAGAGEPLRGLRVPPLSGRRLGARGDAPGDGRARWTRSSRRSARSRRRRARAARPTRPRWPMIILRTPKGWTGPKEVDGKKTEGSWRSHQVPLADMANEAGACQAARAVDEELSRRGAVRRGRGPDPGAGRTGARGRPADGGQSPRQRRAPARRISTLPDFQDYAVAGAETRDRDGGGHAGRSAVSSGT